LCIPTHEIRLSTSFFNTGKIVTTNNLPKFALLTSLKKKKSSNSLSLFPYKVVAYRCCCLKRNGKYVCNDVSLLKCSKWPPYGYSYQSVFFLFIFFSLIVTEHVCTATTTSLFLNINTVEPRFNEGPRDWKKFFAITRFRCIEILYHIFYYY